MSHSMHDPALSLSARIQPQVGAKVLLLTAHSILILHPRSENGVCSPMGFLDIFNCLVKGGTKKGGTKKDGTEAPLESSTADADVFGPRILHSVDNPTVEFAASLSLSTTEVR